MSKKLEYFIHVSLERDDGPPQDPDAVSEALEAEIETLTIEADSRDDGEISTYTVTVTRVEQAVRAK